MADIFARLAEPFPISAINWRVVFSWKRGQKIGAKVSAYIDRGDIVRRLDEVCGPAGWQVRYESTAAHLHAGLGIWVPNALRPEGGEWIWKWDGAGHAEARKDLDSSDAGKSDHTHALKRVAWVCGIGRYLDRDFFAITHADPSVGAFRDDLPQKYGGAEFSWDPPNLPDECLPEGARGQDAASKRRPRRTHPPAGPGGDDGADPETGELPPDPVCPMCSSDLFDNRADKEAGRKSDNWPDLKCRKTKVCGWAEWLPSLRDRMLKATNEAVTQEMPEEHAEHFREAARSLDPALMLRARAKLVELGALEEEEQPA